MFFVFSAMIINVKDGDFTKVFDHLSLNRENESNGEAFASATFDIGDGGMLNELPIPSGTVTLGFSIIVVLCDLFDFFAPLRLKYLTRIVFPFMIRACFVLSDKVTNMAPVESAMLKFNSLLGHWNLRI